MIRRNRALLTLLLSLLLFGMQLQRQAHALEHFGETMRHGPEHSLLLPAAEACATCALLAAGANAMPCDAVDVAPDVVAAETPSFALASFERAAPSYYLSRAPPSLL